MEGVIIGKRITVGAAITSTAVALGYQWPDKAQMFTALSVPVTLLIQIWIANTFGVTTGEEK